MKVLVLLSAAGGGDRQPAIALAVALRDRGHDVAFLCDDATASFVGSTGIGTLPNPREQVGYISRWIKDVIAGTTPPNPFEQWAADAFDGVAGSAEEYAPDVIVSTLFCMGLADALASHLTVPWCVVNPSFYFGEHSVTTWEDDWQGPYVPRLARECFAPLVSRSDLVLHAIDPVFDFPPKRLPDRHHYVGFLLWEPASEVPAFLEAPGNPWALVSASTARPGDELTMLRAAVHGLAGHAVRPVLTAPKGGLPADLSDHALVVGHVPHSLVLQRSAISVNQASAGIVSKCLTYGVPMVLLPWDADQPGNAHRAAAAGVAEIVPREDATAESVSLAVSQVLHSESYTSAAADIASILRSRTPGRTAATLVEQL